MKNLFLSSLLLLAGPLAAWAQPGLSNNPQSGPRFRSNGAENSGIGLKGGVNFNSLQGDGIKKMYSDANQLTQYHFGAYAQIGISNRFSIQPELLYQRKGFKSKGETQMNVTNPADSLVADKSTKLSYLSLPVLFVFNIFDNVAIQVGPQVSYLLNIHDGSKTIDASTYKYNSVDVGVVGGIEAKIEFLRVGARYDYSLTDLRKGGTFDIKVDNNQVRRQAEADIRNGTIQVYLGVGL